MALDRSGLNQALEQARLGLALPPGAVLGADQMSVLFKYLLMAGLGEADQWRARLLQPSQGVWVRRRLEELLQEVRTALPAAWRCAAVDQALAGSPLYRRRLVDLALDGVMSRPLAPEVCIEPLPAGLPDLPGQWHHAVCFAAAPLFTHEFYPLAVDAFTRDSGRCGRAHFNLLGVHLDWFDDRGRIERLLYLDLEHGCLRERQLCQPLVPDSVHFLCLGRREQELHARISARLECPQLNPAGAASLADDKARVLEGWARLGLEIPAWQRLLPGDQAGARRFLERHGEVVVKPNQATEGEGVEFFDGQTGDALDRHLEVLWETGDALIQERADELLYQDPESGARRTVALRLNSAFDGERHGVESGYVQLGVDERSPAAAGRGGALGAVDEVLPYLVRRQDGEAVVVSPAAWERILHRTERAAGLFAELLLIGVDVVLGCDEWGEAAPIFLEANPRPAGLGHARFLRGQERGLPGVSLKLWDGLERLGQSCEAAREGDG